MPKKRLGAEQIVTKLPQVEVRQGHGKSVAAACKEAGRRSSLKRHVLKDIAKGDL